jgi:RNA-directed DNA polymerase
MHTTTNVTSQGSRTRTPTTHQRQRHLELEVATCVGGVLSPLLANIVLHTLDEAWHAVGRPPGVLVRYADDLVAICPTRERAVQARDLVAAVLAIVGLRLHPDKTRIAHLRKGVEGFDFLGAHLRRRQSHRWPGKWYLYRWPSRRAMAAIRGKIRQRTDRRHAPLPISDVVVNLNRVLRDWATTSAAVTRRGTSRPSTRTCGCGWRGWPASNMADRASTGPRRTTTRGSQRLGVHWLEGTVRYGAAHATP